MQSAVFCCPLSHGSLVFVAAFVFPGGSLDCYAHVPVHPPMSTFLHASGVFARHLCQCFGQGSAFLPFHCVYSCSCACACFELALVNLCSQRSVVVHTRMDRVCCSLWVSPPSPLFPPTPPDAYLFMGSLRLARYSGLGC